MSSSSRCTSCRLCDRVEILCWVEFIRFSSDLSSETDQSIVQVRAPGNKKTPPGVKPGGVLIACFFPYASLVTVGDQYRVKTTVFLATALASQSDQETCAEHGQRSGLRLQREIVEVTGSRAAAEATATRVLIVVRDQQGLFE